MCVTGSSVKETFYALTDLSGYHWSLWNCKASSEVPASQPLNDCMLPWDFFYIFG